MKKNNGNLWMVAGYIRLSKEDGRDESLSVSNQRKIISQYLESCFAEEYQMEGWYIDDGISGTDYNRPAFQQMQQKMKAGKVNCIICKNLSRLFRNYSDQGYFLEKIFPMYGIRFISISSPPIDSYLHPEILQGLEVPMNGLMNDRLSAKISRDVRDTFDAKRKKGEFIGAFAPYGYKKIPGNPNGLMIDEEAAQIVKKIYRWFVLEGVSKNQIALRLNQMEVPSPSVYKRRKGFRYFNPRSDPEGSLWSARTVSAILRNQVYTGTMVQGRQRIISYKVRRQVNLPQEEWYRVPGTHEAVIDGPLFVKAQQLQDQRLRSSPGSGTAALFAGLVRCKRCRRIMCRHRARDLVYYQCRSCREKGRSTSIREDRLCRAVLTALQRQIQESSAGDQAAEALMKTAQICEKQTETKEVLWKLQKRRAGLYEDWKEGVLTREEYLELKAYYQEKERRFEAGIRKEEEKKDSWADFLKCRNLQELNRGILLYFLQGIEVESKTEIEIHFAFSDPGKAL